MSRFFFLFPWTVETRSNIKVLFILYFVSDPESESESESEQTYHDSAPLLVTDSAKSEDYDLIWT